MIKVTKPQQMKGDLSDLDKAIMAFEQELLKEDKGQTYYHLVIDWELNKVTCKEIERLYRDAGWMNVYCQTSSEKNERAGLTGLKLSTEI